MILRVLRFKGAIEAEERVRDALARRADLGVNAQGFLGMCAFTDSSDPSVRYLVTKWSDAAAFHAWRENSPHTSDPGSPLYVEDAFEQSVILEGIADGDEATVSPRQSLVSMPFLSKFLQDSRSVHLLTVSLDGTIRSFNENAALNLKVPASQLTGLKIWSYLTEEDATRLWQRVQSNTSGPDERLLINFVDAEHFPYTLECRLDVQKDHFTLLGELPEKGDNVLREHLLQFKNYVAVLTRENAQKSAALEKSRADLEKALKDLETSYWHMRKISEYLPICMQCHKVRTAEARWEDVADYLNKHSLFLTHSLCPPCFATMVEDVKRLNQAR